MFYSVTHRNLKQVHSHAQMPCPQVLHMGDTAGHCAQFFLSGAKLNATGCCSALSLLFSCSPFILGVGGPLLLAGVLPCSCKTSVFKVVYKKEVDFSSSPQWRESENLVLLVLNCGVYRPGNLISLVNISGSWWYTVNIVNAIIFHTLTIFYSLKTPFWLGYLFLIFLITGGCGKD